MSLFKWKKLKWGIILCGFTVFIAIPVKCDEAQNTQITELTVAIQAIREKNSELQQQLLKKEQEMAALRSKYVELMMRSDNAISDSSELLLSGFHLIRAASSDRMVKDEATEMLQVIGLIRRRMIQLSEYISNYELSVNVALETCGASTVTRSDVAGKAAQVKQALNQCLQPMALSEESSSSKTRQSSAVIFVDPVLEVIIVDQGFLNGLRVGMQLELKHAGKSVAKFTVVQCRPLKSALMLAEGNFSAATPGTLLNRVSTGQKPRN